MSAVTHLSEFQKRFISAALDGGNTGTRLGVYRGNALGAIGNALALTYPVTQLLVGGPFFRNACDVFAKKNLPRTGNLDDYGAEFPDFLAEFPPAKMLAYLPDVARLEWLFHESAIAEKADSLPRDALAGMAPEQYASLRFSFHPSARFFSSRFPVHRIWEINQDGAAEESAALDLDTAGGARLLLVRPAMQVRMLALDAAEEIFFAALRESETLYGAFSRAAAENPDFDLAETMRKAMLDGVFTGF